MTLRRLASLLVIFCFAFVLGVCAQEGTKEQPKPSTAQSEQREPKKAQGEPAGLGEQLAKESKEAAGEEDETAQFKESPSVHWIAEHTGLSARNTYWVSFALNFAVIAIVLIVVLKSKLPGAFRARTASIQKGMEDARKTSEDAQRRLGEIEQRLAKLDAEIAGMRQAAEADAAAEEERIRAAAEEDKRKVVEMAEQEIVAAARLARHELKSFAAELAVALAEKRISVDANTDQALVRSFVDQLGAEDGSRKETS